MLNELRFCVLWSRELSKTYAQYPVQEMANDPEKKQLLPWPPYAGQSENAAGFAPHASRAAVKASSPVAATTRLPDKVEQPVTLDENEWLACVQRFEAAVPEELPEVGSLQEIRAVRRQAAKEAKKYRAARRVYRLQRKTQQKAEQLKKIEAAAAAGRAAHAAFERRKSRHDYQYTKQDNYGDILLSRAAEGQPVRVAQLRTASAGEMSCLPTALLALSKTHTQEVRLDSRAQFSVAGMELRKYGRCVTRHAPVDIVEGFGGGRSRVLGVWRFLGTTQYQQRIAVGALVVQGQDDEFLIGEDWMVEKQVKMDFRKKELKYRDERGDKVILPFTCNGIPSLRQGERNAAVVRLAKTVKLTTNTRNIVRVAVDAPDGATGIFLPKPGTKRHLLIAPTVDVVRDGVVRIAVLNVEGKREKLPAREALGT
ncbi:hypothetical protein PF004_g24242 [Phytophthora fragariae]|uniref:Uncharacterized protein n=1 Tax=Phytophthora fragariae TaxID=53985 RepID=A0A6G0MWN1_9STRA|nr:hypothetical protein PF004_g24242 [Phytophthora fragariae]